MSAPVAEGRGQDLSPLDFLLALMRDPETPPQLCIKLAHIVAPYVHPKLGHDPRPANVLVIEDPFGFVIDPDVAKALRDDEKQLEDFARRRYPHPASDKRELEIQARVTQIIKALVCPEGYTESDYAEDWKRICQLAKKRMAPWPHNKLTEEEEAEEAHLAARHTAYRNSPEVVAEREAKSEAGKRIFWLTVSTMGKHPTATPEELSELARLSALYPQLVPRKPSEDATRRV